MRRINIGLCIGISISRHILEMDGQYIIKKSYKYTNICLGFIKIIIIDEC